MPIFSCEVSLRMQGSFFSCAVVISIMGEVDLVGYVPELDGDGAELGGE